MRTSESTNEIATALSLAQGQMSNAALSAVNPHFKSTYSKLEDVWDACRVPLSTNHLAVIQFTEFADNRIVIITRLEHKSGQWYESSLSIKPQQDTPHAIGSAITYGRRYSMMAIVGVSSGETDDDGNEAQGKGKKEQGSKQPSHLDSILVQVEQAKNKSELFKAGLHAKALSEEDQDILRPKYDAKLKTFQEGKNGQDE